MKRRRNLLAALTVPKGVEKCLLIFLPLSCWTLTSGTADRDVRTKSAVFVPYKSLSLL